MFEVVNIITLINNKKQSKYVCVYVGMQYVYQSMYVGMCDYTEN